MIAQRFVAPATRVCRKTGLESTVRRTLYNKVKPLTKDCSEVEIQVPWGTVAGKLWGSENKQPLLAMHGWQDNAGSFDLLAPLLMKNIPVLAIDLPGHGLSSWIQPGHMYHEIIYLLLIQRLKRHFGWNKVKLLAHSLSVQIIYWHAVVFPKDTDFVITLDGYKFPSINVVEHQNSLSKAISKFYKLEEIETPPIRYTEEEVLKRWISGTNNSLDEKSCRALMKRGALQMDDGKYTFTRDPRVKLLPILSAHTHDHLLQMTELITCPFLIIKAENSSYFENVKHYFEALELLQTNNNDVQYAKIPGTHHVHMTRAEAVATVVNPFLEKYNR